MIRRRLVCLLEPLERRRKVKQRGAVQPWSPGYTIIEVMIVLAVSGLMFVIAANFVNGKQAKTAFSEGVNEMASRIQDVIEQVTDGQYSDVPINCQYASGTTSFPPFSPPPTGPTQGINPTCVFLGKVIHLAENSATSPDYEILSIAGGRVDSSVSGNPLADSDPKSIKINSIPLTTQQTIPQNLSVTHVYVNGVLGSYAFGFLQSPGSFDNSGFLQNGAQTIGLYSISGVNAGFDTPSTVTQIDLGHATNITAVNSIDVCLTDNGGRYASITLGNGLFSTGGSLSAKVKMRGSAAC